ncbi:MAG: hypothetical protein SGPRY_008956 [Prymnesium sp.]
MRMKQELEEDVAGALKIGVGAVHVRDVYGMGTRVVADLDAASQDSRVSSTRAELLAQQLQLMLQKVSAGASRALARGGTSRDLDLGAGVQLLTMDGRTTPVLVGGEARDALSILYRYSFEDMFSPLGELSGAALFTVCVASLGLLLACLYTCLRTLQLRQRDETAVFSPVGYGRVAREDEDLADDQEVKRRPQRKSEKKACVRTLDVD